MSINTKDHLKLYLSANDMMSLQENPKDSITPAKNIRLRK